jgi:endonuclease-3
VKKRSGSAESIFNKLHQQHPNAWTELQFRNAFELLVATILSAQSTDRRVNQVTPALFERYPDAASLANAEPAALEVEIRTTGFFRMKARSLIAMARALVADHGGRVPPDIDALVKLPGVGRKTANVVLGHALGVPGLPVDRHVLRVASRIGLVHSDAPEKVERELCAQLPPDRWVGASDVLILHGRRICRPAPLCDRCAVRSDCAYYRRLGPKPTRRPRRLAGA